MLEKCLEAFPTYAPAFRRLAELRVNTDADYRGAYEVLVRWASVDPQIKSDIWFRTVRALGGMKDEREVDRLLDRVFDAQPERLKSVRVAVALHWPCLDRLGEVARKQWLYGAWILWWRPPGYAEIEYASATGHFARSLEIELRDRVFDPFVRSRPDKQALVTDLNEPRPGAQGKHAGFASSTTRPILATCWT